MLRQVSPHARKVAQRVLGECCMGRFQFSNQFSLVFNFDQYATELSVQCKTLWVFFDRSNRCFQLLQLCSNGCNLMSCILDLKQQLGVVQPCSCFPSSCLWLKNLRIQSPVEFRPQRLTHVSVCSTSPANLALASSKRKENVSSEKDLLSVSETSESRMA